MTAATLADELTVRDTNIHRDHRRLTVLTGDGTRLACTDHGDLPHHTPSCSCTACA